MNHPLGWRWWISKKNDERFSAVIVVVGSVVYNFWGCGRVYRDESMWPWTKGSQSRYRPVSQSEAEAHLARCFTGVRLPTVAESEE
mgnify:CR=1 FL=1